MSYFAANTITINRQNDTFKVKGGDNNCYPRSNSWSHEIPLSHLLYELGGGMIQLTSRTDKNIAIDALVSEYNRKLMDLTDLSAYELQYLDEPGMAERLQEAIDRDSYDKPNLIKQLAVLNDTELLFKVNAIKREFIIAARNVKPGKAEYVVTNGYTYIKKKLRTRAFTTTEPMAAQRFTEAKAREIAMNYSGYEAKLIIT